ncbi:hypothetical protein NMG60_11029916 [Bertholletia excelsa]
MPNIFWKNFNFCFSKFKCLPLSPPYLELEEEEEEDHNHPSTSIQIKPFNSLNDLSSDSTFKSLTSSPSNDHFFSSDESDAVADHPPDLAAAFASHRFFFASPGCSNSILDSPQTHSIFAGGVAVPTYSPDPYLDFRRSMQEMIEARELADLKANWDYLHELLLCYLTLNPKHTHKFIIGAFTDLLVSLMSSAAINGRQAPNSHQSSALSRPLL